jgi:serine/threonine protein phosphatase PrpC
MGCINSKFCIRYLLSSNVDSPQYPEVVPYSLQGKHILTQRSLKSVPVPSHNFLLKYSFLTQRGYYPDSSDRENQDSFCIRTQIQGNPNIHFFGVFDGHGEFGAQCSNFVKDRLVEILVNDPALLDDPIKAFNSACLATNDELHNSEIDDSNSGTTAIMVLVVGDTLFVANVGDSRAVIAMKDGNEIVAKDLSSDHNPFREDEYARVKLCGARVLNLAQINGLMDPNIQYWGDKASNVYGPPRLWLPDQDTPGAAFTRSMGDNASAHIGVIAVPEVSRLQLTANHLFFVVASDGVFDSLSSEAVVYKV